MLFMALLAIKNPRMRKAIGLFMGNSAKADMKARAADADGWARDMERAKAEGTFSADTDTENLRQLVLKDAFSYGVSTGAHLRIEFDLVLPMLPYFHGRRWTVFSAPGDRTSFVTSDNPVCLMWQDPQRSEAPGLGRAGTQILFPVANDFAICGTFEAAALEVEDIDRLVPMLNGSVLSEATRQIYARSDDFRYALPHNERTMLGRELLDDAVSKR